MLVNMKIGDTIFTAEFYDNDSARAINANMPFTLQMGDYAGQEKVVGLSFDLPRASTETPSAIHAGEIYLWSGNSLVLFFTTFSNSYSYVPVGKITDTSGLKAALGTGSVEITFSPAE